MDLTRRLGVAAGSVAIAVGLGFGLFSPAVNAGKPTLDSRISYYNNIEGGVYIHAGTVRSDSQACERGRTVLLFGEGIEKAFDSDRTDAQGGYEILTKQDSLAADYYTRVRRVEKPSAICKAAESKHKPLN